MDDWENDDFEPPLPAGPSQASNEADAFAEEAEMLRRVQLEQPKLDSVASQPKKKEEKAYLRDKGQVEEPLDDPTAEKLRRQRLEEQSDLLAAKDLFGGAGDGMNLDVYLPRTLKEFETYASNIVSRYVTIHQKDKNFKAFIKSLVKSACSTMTSSDMKDIESSLAGARIEKAKAEQAEVAASKKSKKNINVGRAGDLAGGLDDYKYDDIGGDDDDFM